MQAFKATHTPAEIVRQFPKASDFFREHQIDFCCGGDKPLEQTFLEGALDSENILYVLNEAYRYWTDEGHKAKDWDEVSLSEIIDHIVHHHHTYLYDVLPGLGDLVAKIFRVHGAEDAYLKDLNRAFNAFRMEMDLHSMKEEQEVFPLIKKYEKEPSDELLDQIRIANGGLEDEHDYIGTILKEMRQVTNGYSLPTGACNSYRITYERLEELEQETFDHVHLENNILFKRL